jgi:hyperosmotically inducible protein
VIVSRATPYLICSIAADLCFGNINVPGKGLKMNILDNLKVIGLSTLLVVGLSACDKPGPAETAGKNIDRSVDQVGKKISETSDKIGEKMSEQGAKAGVAIADTEITTKVKAAIFAEPGLKTLQISVDTVKGVVTLTGSVNSQSNSDMAKALAVAVHGVKDVDNRLLVTAGK